MEGSNNSEPDPNKSASDKAEGEIMNLSSESVLDTSSLPEPKASDEFLYKILELNEYNALNKTTKDKIENAVQEKILCLVVKEALHQTYKTTTEETIKKLRADLESQKNISNHYKAGLDATEAKIKLLEEELLKAEEDVKKANENCKKMQYEWQDFKTQRDLACDEKESLLTMIERRNSELMVLREEKLEMAKKLDAAIKAKMAALENAQDVESQKISLNYKEKRLEQESNILKSQLKSLNEELAVKSAELLDLRRTLSTKAVTDESELASKTEELRIALETIADLKQANEKLTNRSEELLEKLSSQRETYDVMMDNFHQELSAQTKLAQLYKGMCNENETKTEKLTDSIQQLRGLLDEATEKYGELETKHKDKVLRLQEEISKRDECIQNLKKELQDANQLLEAAKQDSVDAAIGSLSPCAAVASRLIKSGMTLTQIYTQYARVSEELALEKEENRRLNLYVTTIVNEIEEKAPMLQQQRVDYEKAVAAAESLTQEMDRMVTESQMLSQECTEAKKISGHLTRENQRLKKEIADLARQVCYLVKAVEEARGGKVSHDTAYEMTGGSAQDVISRHLVTFATIEDLQENNQKLLSLVRQLSEKQEAVESVSIQEYHELKTKKEQLEERINEFIEEIGRQSKMLDLIRTQSQTYKKLYNQAMGNDSQTADTPGSPMQQSPQMFTSTPLPNQPDLEAQKKLAEAKETIQKLEDKIEELKKRAHEREIEIQSQMDNLNAEIKNWMFKNSKLAANSENIEEKNKVLDANLKVSRKQIQALEDRNRTISEICSKHEQSLVMLKDQAMEAQSKLARAEVQRENLQQEVMMLKMSEIRLTKEVEALSRERLNNTLLMNNLDGLKATLDRSEAEGKLRLEIQLSEALKECSALRSSLRDEKDRFRELTNSMERQVIMAKERMTEEKTLADKARNDLLEVKNDLEEKLTQIEELKAKLRELSNQPARSVIQTASINVDDAAKRVKELEQKVNNLESEKEKLVIQLNSAQASSKQYSEMAEVAEAQLQQLTNEHHNCALLLKEREKAWADAFEANIEKNTKAFEALEAKKAKPGPTDLDIEELKRQVVAAKEELEESTIDLENVQSQLVQAQEEIIETKELLVDAESRYSQEVVAHSQAIQSLNAAQEQLKTAREGEGKLQQKIDNLIMVLTEKTRAWEDQTLKAQDELDKLSKRVKDLDEQNSILHLSLHGTNDQLSTLQAKVGKQGTSDLDSCKLKDLAPQGQEQLMKVIHFLRQEKDIATTKSEVLESESTRLKAQIALLQRELLEAKTSYENLKQSSDVTESTSAKHAELLRKVESLNAVTDSNRLLREERNRLKTENSTLSEKLAKAEAQLAPLQAEIKELKIKVEKLTTENLMLKKDVELWKVRSTQLSERTKATPEDWRKLNSERDSLSKQFVAEKAKNEKLEESLKKVKSENSALAEQIADLRTQLSAEAAKLSRMAEEANAAKLKQSQTDEELYTVRAQVQTLTENVTKVTQEGTAKDAVITDLRTKEIQIKKIAKKYKTQYEELVKTNEENNKKRAEEEAAKQREEANKPVVIPEEEQEKLRAEGRAQVSAQCAELAEKQKELDSRLATAVEEAENLKKDNEALKTSINEKEERARNVIKTARSRIGQLTEQKQTLEQELSQIREENEAKLSTMKANYDAVIDRMEKERTEQAELANQERERLSNQNKSLNQRITQMQRSLDKPKPSTSSQPVQKSSMEPPTANIKPMAGSSTARKQHPQNSQLVGVGPYWTGGSETPFASIRPVQTRTLAVQPTSVGSGSPAPNVSAASPGATPILQPLQQQCHTTGSSAGDVLISSPTSSHTDYMPATSSATLIRVLVAPVPLNAQSTEEGEEVEAAAAGPPPQSVAMVVPRVEASASAPTAGSSSGLASSSSNSSNTVTTSDCQSQPGHKRTREETDPDTDHSKSSPQLKRTRVSGSGLSEVFHAISHSEMGEVEYQVPTSSQRDQEDDMVIMLEDSDEEDGNADDGEGEEPDDEFEEDNGEAFEVESYSRDAQEMENYEEGPDIDEDNGADAGSSEVEIVDDSNEVPVVMTPGPGVQQQQSSEATSSANDNNTDHVVVSHAASSHSFRTRSVPPLNRAQTSMQVYEEVGDDCIVPSTPTLFLPRREEAVSSPQVPHPRFTFSEPGAGTSRRDDSGNEDPGTGRSVPTTPLVASPQDVGQDQVEPSLHLPAIIAEDDMPPPVPSVGGDDQEDTLDETEAVEVQEDSDGVTSEGEKPPTTSGELMEEGREAEASEPIARTGGTARRSGRPSYPRRGPSRRPTPIVWHEPGSSNNIQVPRTPQRGATRGRSRRNW